MKFGKRFAAICAAMMITLCGSTISAFAVEDFSLYYTITAPSSANQTQQEFGNNIYSPLFWTVELNKITMNTSVTSLNANNARTRNYKYNLSQETWNYVKSITRTTTGTSSTTKNYASLPTHTILKIKVDMDYSGLNSASAYGHTTTY